MASRCGMSATSDFLKVGGNGEAKIDHSSPLSPLPLHAVTAWSGSSYIFPLQWSSRTNNPASSCRLDGESFPDGGDAGVL
jgi:hypothetical protein